jgi:hypothetical protein
VGEDVTITTNCQRHCSVAQEQLGIVPPESDVVATQSQCHAADLCQGTNGGQMTIPTEADLDENFADLVKRKIRIYWDCFKYINFQIYRLFRFQLNRYI